MKLLIDVPEEIKRRFDYEYNVDGEISKYTTDTILQIVTDGFIRLNELKQKQEPKTGHWIRQTDDYRDYYECEHCGIAVGLDDIKNYCPGCGSKNEVEQ